MGAYLSEPKVDKISTDDVNDYLVVGASSMQGWRNSQEDAHNAILNFDEAASFFAVYDGHGGAEVAAYCADKLPEFLKALNSYKEGNLEIALKEAFLGFDKTLLDSQVIEILKVLAGDHREDEAEESDEDDDEDLVGLHEESNLSLKEVLKRYGGKIPHFTAVGNDDNVEDEDDDDDEDGGGPSFSMPSLKRLSDGGAKPQSPFLRGRRAAAVIADAVNKAVLDADAKPAGSSTSAAALAAGSSADKDVGASSSQKSTITKMDTDEDATVSSTNTVPSAAKQQNASVLNNHTNTVETTEAEATVASKVERKAIVSTNGEGATPDSSHIVKENEQNGNVTSTETTAAVNSKQQVSTSVTTTCAKAEIIKESNSANDATVSGSNEAANKQQNGGTDCSSAASSSVNVASTSTGAKAESKAGSILNEEDSTDDDADYDEGNPSGEDDDEDEDEEEEDDEEDDYDVDEDGDEADIEEDDEETIVANEQFCANMIEEPGKDSGCTAVVALLHGRDLYVANAGDSRCVVCRNGKAIEMSLDHKPEDAAETDRILNAGGRVSADGRVNGGLNLSRAIGDHAYKMNAALPAEQQMISAQPDIKKLIISPEDEFMILACDGIWNYMSSEEVVRFVRKRLQKDETQQLSKICEELFDNCLAPNTMGDGTGCDNMTAVIVRFKSQLQELSTKINPEETNDVVLEKAEKAAEAEAQSSELNSLKRVASSSLNDQEQQTKRLKTDNEEENNSSAASSTITSSTTSSQQSSSKNENSAISMAVNVTETDASSSTSTTAIISTSEAITSANNNEPIAVSNNANECDSVNPDSSEASASATV